MLIYILVIQYSLILTLVSTYVTEGTANIIQYNSLKQFEPFNTISRWTEQYINDYQYLDKIDMIMISSTSNIYFFKFGEAKVISTYTAPQNQFLKQVKCSFEAEYTNCYLLNSQGNLFQFSFLQAYQFEAVVPSLLNLSSLKVESITELKTVMINNEENSSYYSIALDNVQNQRFLIYTVVKSNGQKINNTKIQIIQKQLCSITGILEVEDQQFVVSDSCGSLLYINLSKNVEQIIIRQETPFPIVKMTYSTDQKYFISVMVNSQTNNKRLAFYNTTNGFDILTPIDAIEGYDFKILTSSKQQELQFVQVLPEEGSKIIKVVKNKGLVSMIELSNQISYLYFIPKNNATIHIESNYKQNIEQKNAQLYYPLFFLELNIVTQQLNIIYQKCPQIDDQLESAKYFTQTNNCSFSSCQSDQILEFNQNICRGSSISYEYNYIQIQPTMEIGQLMFNYDRLILNIVLGLSIFVVLIIIFIISKCVQQQELDILIIQKKQADIIFDDKETNLNMNSIPNQENESISDIQSSTIEKYNKLPNLKNLYNRLINNYQNVQDDNLEKKKKIINNDSDEEDNEDISKNTIMVPEEQYTQNYTEFFRNPTLQNYTQENYLNDDINNYQFSHNNNGLTQKQKNNEKQRIILDDYSSVQFHDDGLTYIKDYTTINQDQNTLNFENQTLNFAPPLNNNKNDRRFSALDQYKKEKGSTQNIIDFLDKKSKFQQIISDQEQSKQEQKSNNISDGKHITPKRLKRKKTLDIINDQPQDYKSLGINEDISLRKIDKISNNKIMWDGNSQYQQMPNQRTEDLHQKKKDLDILKKNQNNQDFRSRYNHSPLILNYVNSKKQNQIDISEEQYNDKFQFTTYSRNNELRRSRSMQLPIQNQTIKLDDQQQQKESIKKKIQVKLQQMNEKRTLKKSNQLSKLAGEND